MAITAVATFEISNDFFEWEKAFYAHQPIARQAGMYELYHGYDPQNPKQLVVIMMAPSPEAMDKFFKDNAESVAASGHLLETTQITIYNN